MLMRYAMEEEQKWIMIDFDREFGYYNLTLLLWMTLIKFTRKGTKRSEKELRKERRMLNRIFLSMLFKNHNSLELILPKS